jgi:hypothetical protein
VYDNLPHELKALRIWCVWRYVKNPKREKPDKVPFNPITGTKAKTNYPDEFVSFNDAVKNAEKYDGIGVIVPHGVVFIDIDECVENGVINEFAKEIIRKMNIPFEVSPSGKGLRGYCKAQDFQFDKKKYYIVNRNIGMEVYVGGATHRFLTITGNIIHEAEFCERGEQLQALLDEYMLRSVPLLDKSEIKSGCSYLTDDEVIEKATAAKNGEKFHRVWHGDTSDFPSDSEADVYLSGRLAFWCGCDYEQMERLHSQSAMGQREKWERADYKHMTIVKAISGCKETYSLEYKKTHAADVFDIEAVHKLVRPATEIKSQAVPWLIEGIIIRKSLSSIQGLPGSGKSWLTCALAVAVANGGEFPKANGEMMKLPHGRVLICNFDDSVDFGLMPRLEKLGLTDDGRKRVFFLDSTEAIGITFSDKRLAAVFEEFRPDLAIFDTLQHFVSGRTDFHRANEMNEAIVKIKVLSEHYNTGTVIVQHVNKNAGSGSGGDSVLWGLGSTSINGLFRSIWTVGRIQSSDKSMRAVLSSKNNLLAYVPPTLKFSLTQDEGFQWRGTSNDITASDLIRGDSVNRGRRASHRDEAQEFIFRELLWGEKVKASDIFKKAESKGFSESTIKRAKARLNGIETFREGGVWYWQMLDECKDSTTGDEFLTF